MTSHRVAAWLCRSFTVLALAGAAVSCAPPQQPSPVDAGAATTPEAVPEPLNGLGQLQVFVTGQMTDGRNIKLRGLIRNPYTDPVEGVRLIFRMLSAPDVHARELDRFQKVLGDRLDTGGQAAFSFDVQTMYAGASGAGFLIQAFAVKRAGQDLPLPPDWKGAP